jgi:hypothetical protein
MKRSLSLALVFLWAGTLLAACLPDTSSSDFGATPSAAAPSATATRVWFPPTATATRYLPPTVTPTPAGQLRYGDILFADQFSESNDWVSGSFVNGNVAYDDHKLNLAVSTNGASLLSLRKNTAAADLFLELTILPNLCSPADVYGIAFWVVNEQHYSRLAFDCSGQFALERVKDGRTEPYIPWTPSSQVPRGGLSPLRVGLWIGGGLVRVFLNNQLVAETYLPPAAGGIGFFAESHSRAAMNISYSDLQAYAISPADYPPTPTPTPKPTKVPYPTQPTP